MSALSDEPSAKPKEPTEGRVLPMTCEVCEHKWSVPTTMAGKNVLCPECQRRQRVPELKLEQKEDWRQQQSKLPTLARPKEEKLEGVQASNEAQNVSIHSMERAGAIEEDLDPLPTSYKLVVYGLPLALLLVAVGFTWKWIFPPSEKPQMNLIAEARAEFDSNPPEMQPSAPVNALMRANLELAEGENRARNIHTPKDLEEAHHHLSRAFAELRLERRPPAERKRADRNALLGELAITFLLLGGTKEQVDEQLRYRWLPNITPGRSIRINEQSVTVYEKLGHVLKAIQVDSDFDFRLGLARRLVRELLARGQIEMAQNLSLQLFSPTEQPEAKAVVALEIQHLDSASPVPAQIAKELEEPLKAKKGKGTGPQFDPYPATAVALFKACNVKKADLPVLSLPNSGPIQEPYLRANLYELAKQDVNKAIAVATRKENSLDTKFRGLLVIAEFYPDPAIDVAAGLAPDLKTLKPGDFRKLASTVYRFSQIAAQAGKFDQAKAFANTLPEGGYREWASGEIVRQRLARSTEPADASLMELPEDRTKWCPGHAWGRMAIARQGGRLGDDKKKYAEWPSGVIHPFALAGLALGMQDKNLQ